VLQNKTTEALSWFEKATSLPLDFYHAGEALVNKGKIFLERNNTEEAEKAFSTVALELDEPNGYFYLSKMVENGSARQKLLLTKAAASGIVEAAHNLGALELADIEKHKEKPRNITDYGMAREWFEMAAAGGFGLSMLNLALIYRALGQPSGGLLWLEKAEKLPETHDQAIWIRAQWENEDIELS